MSLAARRRPSHRERAQGASGMRQEELTMNPMARRMFELVEPIGVLPYSADEPNETMFALGFTNYWDPYFAGRAPPHTPKKSMSPPGFPNSGDPSFAGGPAPRGGPPAEVVDALFYNFAPGEV